LVNVELRALCPHILRVLMWRKVLVHWMTVAISRLTVAIYSHLQSCCPEACRSSVRRPMSNTAQTRRFAVHAIRQVFLTDICQLHCGHRAAESFDTTTKGLNTERRRRPIRVYGGTIIFDLLSSIAISSSFCDCFVWYFRLLSAAAY